MLLLHLLTAPKAYGCDLDNLPFGAQLSNVKETYGVYEDEVRLKGRAFVPFRVELLCSGLPEETRGDLHLMEGKLVKLSLVNPAGDHLMKLAEASLGEIKDKPIPRGGNTPDFEHVWGEHDAFVAVYALESGEERLEITTARFAALKAGIYKADEKSRGDE